MKKIKKKKVMVAMSGGVDSSVAAALLKKAGPAPEQARYGVNFDVVGVYMKCWEGDSEKSCRSLKEDEYMARRAAAKIGIPFYKFDFTKEYKGKVIDYFVREYAKGRTPNPDVMCNKEIKFGLFFDKAISLGFDFVATGHYAQISPGRFEEKLFCGKDPQKDQSYFLYKVTPEKLKKVIFPVGKYRKTQVRKIARALGLPNADRKDSQGICFVGKVKLTDFLKNYIKPKPGPIVEHRRSPTGRTLRGKQVHYGARRIVDSKMRTLGYHQGLAFYTIGQRKGIKLPGGPFYVVDKNVKENLLIVSRSEKDLHKKELVAENINWFSPWEPSLPLKVKAQIRYRQEPVPATITKNLDARTYSLKFTKLQRAIAPGQSVVFYQGKKLLGGGIIKS